MHKNLFTITSLASLFFPSASHAEFKKTVKYKPEVKKYVKYLEKKAIDPVDYVMGLFEQNDIVVLGERMHTEMSQWDFIYKLVSDSRFIKNVGNIFTETGGGVYQQPELEAFMAGESADEKAIIHLMRGSPVWPDGWPWKNYHDFLVRLHGLNQELDAESKIHLYFSDIPRNWEKITPQELEGSFPLIFVRDEFMAARIYAKFTEISKSPSRRKKALAILNYRHAFSKDLQKEVRNAAACLMEKLGHRRIKTVMFNDHRLLQEGKWDATFSVFGNKPMGFSFQDSPFGKDHFDLWSHTPHKFAYRDIFEGMVFYGAMSQMTTGIGYPGYYDKEFKDIFKRRTDLFTESLFTLLPEMRQMQDSWQEMDKQIANTDWEPKPVKYDPAPIEQWFIGKAPANR